MRKIIINGGKKLQGEVTVSGAKNSVVALIPAIILSDGVVTLDGVHELCAAFINGLFEHKIA